MGSFGDVCELVFSISVMVYVLCSYNHIKLLKEQNRQLAELLDTTCKAANVIKNLRSSNEHSDESKRSATKDGDQERDN